MKKNKRTQDKGVKRDGPSEESKDNRGGKGGPKKQEGICTGDKETLRGECGREEEGKMKQDEE
jgi:hypothetical protein